MVLLQSWHLNDSRNHQPSHQLKIQTWTNCYKPRKASEKHYNPQLPHQKTN